MLIPGRWAIAALCVALSLSFPRFGGYQARAVGLGHAATYLSRSFEVGKYVPEGVRFLTMELVEGQGLDRIVTPDGLELSKVFDIGIAVADALSAALSRHGLARSRLELDAWWACEDAFGKLGRRVDQLNILTEMKRFFPLDLRPAVEKKLEELRR